MLFWSFVLAFVLAILYYISPTYNVVQVEQKPMADTMVAAFVNTHQAAKRLMYTDTVGTKQVTQQCDGTDSAGNPIKVDCVDAIGTPVKIDVEDTSSRKITFNYKGIMNSFKTSAADCANTVGNGVLSVACAPTQDGGKLYSIGSLAEINPDDIDKMLPTIPVDKLGDITSAVACIADESSDTEIKTNADGSITTSYKKTTPYLTFDCAGKKNGGIGDYVITYMQAPDSEHAAMSRNELWRSGILRRTKGSHECGVLWPATGFTLNEGVYDYTVDNGNITGTVASSAEIGAIERRKYDIDAEYVLDNSRRFTISVPKAITDVLKQDEALKNDMDSGYLLFCITPISDIRASFEWKCTHGYGKYKIMDGDTVVKDCATGE